MLFSCSTLMARCLNRRNVVCAAEDMRIGRYHWEQTALRRLHANARQRDTTSYTSFLPGAFFVICMMSFLVTGIVCIAFPPEATNTYDEHVIPDTAKCLRITRHSDYVSVDIVIGTSASLLNLLLRLDMVKGSNETAMRLFSTSVAESDSVSCLDRAVYGFRLVAHPRAIFTTKASSGLIQYTNPTTEAMTYGTAVTIHLDGEFALKQGYDYFLTATHLCWDTAAADLHSGAEPDATDNEGAVPAQVDNGFLKADAAGLQQTATMRTTPVGRAHIEGTCLETLGKWLCFLVRQRTRRAGWASLVTACTKARPTM